MNIGRDKLYWGKDTWDRIDRAVHDECSRTKVAAKFLPIHGPVSPSQMTIQSDLLHIGDNVLSVDETEVSPILECAVDFKMTRQQVEREPELMTAVTLATRAANLLSQAQDLIVFQGRGATEKHALFKRPGTNVRVISGKPGEGLANVPTEGLPKRNLKVDALAKSPRLSWGENSVRSVADAYSNLQSGTGSGQAHYGPYALVLHHVPFADTYAPLPSTLIMPADRIRPLVGSGFFGTSTLPDMVGLLISLGGNTVDLVVAQDATTAYLQEDTDGRFRFRVFERFALRIKDWTSVVRIEFSAPVGPQ